MDTERRMTTQEMLTQHKKLMDEAQRLEPSVIVTERNWNAMLKMQHDLFQQQMQLDTDLKTLLTREDAQTALNEMQESTEKFEKQAGSLNARYSSACKELTERTQKAVTMISENGERAISTVAQEAKKNCMIPIPAGNTYNKKGGGQHQYTEETVAGAGKERACRTALAELLQSGSV